ncbi:CbbQ/NirQ/NorQ/GpvN family protein [Bdellovibrio bacteriovorus]|uniref:AAA family ATPase n=1 Tax=Bdellovibrio bacteriovorus TaxID=959 RepID=A0A150WU59_BDEBC|nr:CbbQ/NirQ/NorQ/GpvN family protein [Bdellovibrio bacteriovorus]KYG70130.1 AAA family ATPase [Bdellovibrio bacteriovorus]
MKENKLFYHPRDREIEFFEKAYKLSWPLLLKGPTGCGKSRFVQYMAEKVGRPLIEVACHEETSATDLVGRYILKGGETFWQDGPLVKALRDGAILYLDEVAEAREDIIVALHPVLDHRRTLFIDKTRETLHASPGFMIVASYNPHYQSHLKELKPSTKQRFMALSFDYPREDDEVEIVHKESGLEKTQVEKLVRFSAKVRSLDHLDLRETVSTRLIIAAAALIKEGAPRRASVDCGIIQALTDESETVEALREAAALYF